MISRMSADNGPLSSLPLNLPGLPLVSQRPNLRSTASFPITFPQVLLCVAKSYESIWLARPMPAKHHRPSFRKGDSTNLDDGAIRVVWCVARRVNDSDFV